MWVTVPYVSVSTVLDPACLLNPKSATCTTLASVKTRAFSLLTQTTGVLSSGRLRPTAMDSDASQHLQNPAVEIGFNS